MNESSSVSEPPASLPQNTEKVRLPPPRAVSPAVAKSPVGGLWQNQLFVIEQPPVTQPILSCPTCGVHLLGYLPGTAFNCPGCSASIAIAAAPQAMLPAATPQALSAPAPPAVSASKASEGAEQVPRFKRSGVFTFKPLNAEDEDETSTEAIAETSTEGSHQDGVPALTGFKKVEVDALEAPEAPELSPPSRKKQLLITLAVVVTLSGVVGALALLGRSKRTAARESIAAIPEHVVSVRSRLEQAARDSLKNFLNAGDPLTKSQWVIGGAGKVQAIQERLADGSAIPSFSEEGDEIVTLPMTDDEARKGLCTFIYRPVADAPLFANDAILPLEVATGIAPPNPLQEAALVEDSSGRVAKESIALFRLQDEQMLLDWDLFIQTLDRSFIAFRDGSLGKGPLRFRVVLSVDKPVFENGETVDLKVYHLQDPLHAGDSLRLQVDLLHPDEPLLRLAFHDKTGELLMPVQPRTATVDLVRDPESGAITLSKFVCWEFLGVGGTELVQTER